MAVNNQFNFHTFVYFDFLLNLVNSDNACGVAIKVECPLFSERSLVTHGVIMIFKT